MLAATSTGPGLGPVFTFSSHFLLDVILYKEAFVWTPDVQVTSCHILSASQCSHLWSEVLWGKSGRIYFDLTSICFTLHWLPSWFVPVFESRAEVQWVQLCTALTSVNPANRTFTLNWPRTIICRIIGDKQLWSRKSANSVQALVQGEHLLWNTSVVTSA